MASRSLLEALDRIADNTSAYGGIEYPQLALGPVEQILAFNTNEHHVLKEGDTETPYFSNQGVITDLHGRVQPGTRIETSLRVHVKVLPGTYEWPPEQPEPFDQPPSVPTNTDPVGQSKQAYFFADGSSLVTVGPSVPKILKVKGGGAHLWVASVGVIAQGKGKYKGARGISAYTGCAHFPHWPEAVPEQIKLLSAGFNVKSAAFFKLVLKGDQE